MDLWPRTGGDGKASSQFRWSQFEWQRGDDVLPAQANPLPLIEPDANEMPPNEIPPVEVPEAGKKRFGRRYIAGAVVLALAVALVVGWYASAPAGSTAATQPGFSVSSSSTRSSGTPTSDNSANSGGTIQAYIVGAVRHPGVYTLPEGARVYQLLQAAGGPMPNANLVALNLAAILNDGQEVYVTMIGERPPTYVGGVPGPSGTSTSSGTPGATGPLVNINTATVDDMRQNLHVSAQTAENIINYRVQHGPYTSVEQLLQVVSRSIYDKIKDKVTV